jgi:hypothetical protein
MSSKAIAEIMKQYNPVQERRVETEKLVSKWEATGLLEGIEGENKVHNMAQLLENQARQLIDESSRVGGPGTEEWSGVALPLVRRIFGELAAQEFVSVQPMNLPSGLIFYLDFKYGTANQGFSVGEDVYGNTSASGDPTGGLYGQGKFAYSTKQNTTAAQTIHASTIASGTFTTSSVAWSDVDFEPDLSASVNITAGADNSLNKLTVSTAAMTRPDTEAVRSMVISGSLFDEYFPAYTKLSGSSNTEVVFIVRQSAAGTAGDLTVKYSAQPTDSTRGDFEVSTSEDWSGGDTGDIGIPEIDIQLRQVSIVAKTRKLKAVWTPELAQDLNAYHSVDAEAELTAMLSEYVSMEIDLEILDMLRANADAKTERWSAKVGFEYDSGVGAFLESSGASNAYTKGEWFQTLGNKIQSVSNAIHQKTLRGGANFIVVSPETATIIESIPGYASDSNADSTNTSYAMGVQKVGALNNRYTVYKNPYFTENVVLVGFRGSNFLETGAVYAPYVPLIMTPLVYDPSNFTPRKGVMTRYAKKMVRPEFYGQVVVADVNYA